MGNASLAAVPPEPIGEAPFGLASWFGVIIMGAFAILFGTSIIIFQKDVPVIIGLTLIIIGTAGIAYGASLIPARKRGDI